MGTWSTVIARQPIASGRSRSTPETAGPPAIKPASSCRPVEGEAAVHTQELESFRVEAIHRRLMDAVLGGGQVVVAGIVEVVEEAEAAGRDDRAQLAADGVDRAIGVGVVHEH